uniref:Uncharacterized protein n=1 Tax=Haplochromis burtoni TaxID=8153 RepID=A0A3Q2WYX6_HAPBU
MIQSSQPRSLKFTCRGFLLHLDFDFLPCRFPWRVLDAAVLRLLLALVPGPLSLGLFSRPSKALPSLLSLKSLPCRCSPRRCRSSSLSGLSSTALSSRQKCFPWLRCCRSLNISHTSSTSHLGLWEPCRSSVLESSSCWSWQERSWISAPSTSAFSERVETSNRYCCLLRGESGRSSVESIKTAGSDRNPSSALVLSLSRSLSCGRGGPELDSASAPVCSKWLLRKVRTAQRDRRRAV